MKCLKRILEANIRQDQIEEIKLDLTNLNKIDLSNNEIVTLEKNIFKNMNTLVKINLSNILRW